MKLFKRDKTPPAPSCTCEWYTLGGGPNGPEYDQREDNPQCPVHHP
jgi:hypothetical protein